MENDKKIAWSVRSIPAELKTREAAKDDPIIEGYFAVFDGTYNCGDGMYETIDPHAFDDELSRKGDFRALVNHDDTLVLGRTSAGTLELNTDDHGLHGIIHVNPNDTDAMNLYARVQRGDVSQCSFGFEILDEASEVLNGGEQIHWTIKRVKLYEVSPCTFPAYESTAIAARSADKAKIMKREREAWVLRMTEKLKGVTHGTEGTAA